MKTILTTIPLLYIRRLRTKIEDDPGNPKRIVTVRRMGYKWTTED